MLRVIRSQVISVNRVMHEKWHDVLRRECAGLLDYLADRLRQDEEQLVPLLITMRIDDRQKFEVRLEMHLSYEQSESPHERQTVPKERKVG
jgi:hypothetical protein